MKQAPDSSKSGAIGNESQSPWGARKKVLYLITKATWGGAQRYVYDLAEHLPEEFEPTVAYGVPGRLSEMLTLRGIKIHNIPSLGRDIAFISDIKSFFEMLRYFKETRPDVLHLNSSKAAGLGALAARIAGIPKIIFTVHGWPFKEDRSSASRALIHFVSWLTALLSHRIIVVSRTDERIASRMWGITRKVTYVPLSIGRVETLSPPEGFVRIFGSDPVPKLTGSTLRIITIGELTRNKGLRFGIEAIAELSQRGVDCIYVIVGEGENMDSLRKLATEAGVSDRVYFTGFVTDAAQYLAGFDVFLLPSLKEGMPYVLLEAGAVGLPIVSTSVVDTELKEIFTRMRFVAPGDASAIADAILELSKIPKGSMVESHANTLEVMAQKTAKLYY